MKTLSRDTSPAAEAVIIAGYRRMTPQQKLNKVCQLNLALKTLQLARLRAQYGEMSPREEVLRLGALRLPRELMIAAFGWDPEVEGY